MNKLLKKLALVMFAVIGLVNLASCGEYNFYKDWSEAGANIESENIFEVLTLEEAKNKIANEKENTFILVVGTSQSSVAASSIETLQAQAEYLDYEGTIYFVDSTDYIEKRKTRAELCEALKIAEITKSTSADLIVVAYVDGVAELDSSNVDCEILEHLQSGSSLNMEAVAYYLYRDFNKQ